MDGNSVSQRSPKPFSHSFIDLSPVTTLILVRVALDPKPILGKLGVKWE